jgi:hypothetical protein
MGTEISLVALKNHVERVVWYGGDAYPVLDQHWIAKQYYHDLLATTPLPATQETFDKFFNWIFERGNCILWIDELMSVGSVQRFPRGLGRLMQQGRSKGVGVWSCTQRPSGIPAIVPASCSYFFVFDIRYKSTGDWFL